MKIYKHGEQTFAIIEGELWAKVATVEQEPDQAQSASRVTSAFEHSKPGKRKGRKPSKYGRRNPMPEELKEEIRSKYSEGVSEGDLAEEYGVARNTIYKILKAKPERLTTKHAAVQNYVCVNGHEFSSKLQPGEVMCPTCRTQDCNLGTLNGPVAEGEDV